MNRTNSKDPVYVLFLRHCRSCAQYQRGRLSGLLRAAVQQQPSCTSTGRRQAQLAAWKVRALSEELGLEGRVRIYSSMLPRAMETGALLGQALGGDHSRYVKALCFVGERASALEGATACTSGTQNVTSWPLARCFARRIAEETGVPILLDSVPGLTGNCSCSDAQYREVSARCLDASGATAKTRVRCLTPGRTLAVPPLPSDFRCFEQNLEKLLDTRTPTLHVVISHGRFIRESFPELRLGRLGNLNGVLARATNGQLIAEARFDSGVSDMEADRDGEECVRRDARRGDACRKEAARGK